MPKKTSSLIKAGFESFTGRLSRDKTIDDHQYYRYVIEKVQHGLEAAENEGTLTQEEAEEKLGKWLIRNKYL